MFVCFFFNLTSAQLGAIFLHDVMQRMRKNSPPEVTTGREHSFFLGPVLVQSGQWGLGIQLGIKSLDPIINTIVYLK